MWPLFVLALSLFLLFFCILNYFSMVPYNNCNEFLNSSWTNPAQSLPSKTKHQPWVWRCFDMFVTFIGWIWIFLHAFCRYSSVFSYFLWNFGHVQGTFGTFFWLLGLICMYFGCTLYVVCMYFVCTLYALFKSTLYIQSTYKVHMYICTLETAYKLHTHYVQTAYKLHIKYIQKHTTPNRNQSISNKITLHVYSTWSISEIFGQHCASCHWASMVHYFFEMSPTTLCTYVILTSNVSNTNENNNESNNERR